MNNAFKIKKDEKILDYRKAATLDIDKVKKHFGQKFNLIDLKQENRHVIGTIEYKSKNYILKLSTTEGIGARTETEKLWNDEFNKYSRNRLLRVPINFEDGYYEGLYYIIIEKFEGPLLSTLHGENDIIGRNIETIIDFSEYIQTLQLNVPVKDMIQASNAQEWFVEKTKSWLGSINIKIIQEYKILQLWNIVQESSKALIEKPRHGDFTPWHMMALENGGIGLIDGEHAHSHGVEHYDISYFMQRVYSVLNKKELAEQVLSKILTRDYSKDKIKTVLASRAIGGFLDESFKDEPKYKIANEFSEWVLKL